MARFPSARSPATWCGYNPFVQKIHMNTWRFIRTPPMRGAENMAIDEAIFEGVIKGTVAPTLRLYAWEPPCLSLGYAQPLSDVDMGRLLSNGWELVRRPTGGRAILHTDEITYAIIAPVRHPQLSGGVLECYKKLSPGLVRTLEMLDLRVAVHPEIPLSDAERVNPICFRTPSAYEITVDGKKLIGSAQVRRRGGVLQHGTIPLKGDIARICEALVYENDSERRRSQESLRSQASTVEALLGTTVSWEEAAEAFRKGFSQAMGWSFIDAELQPEEVHRSQVLVAQRFEAQDWLHRV